MSAGARGNYSPHKEIIGHVLRKEPYNSHVCGTPLDTWKEAGSGACPPLAGPHKIHWSIQSTAPNFFGNAFFFIIVLYRETKDWFKKLETRK